MAAPTSTPTIKVKDIPLDGLRVLVDYVRPGLLVGTIGRDDELEFDVHLDAGGGMFVDPARVTREPAGSLGELKPYIDKAIAAELRRIVDFVGPDWTRKDVLDILRIRADEMDGDVR